MHEMTLEMDALENRRSNLLKLQILECYAYEEANVNNLERIYTIKTAPANETSRKRSEEQVSPVTAKRFKTSVFENSSLVSLLSKWDKVRISVEAVLASNTTLSKSSIKDLASKMIELWLKPVEGMSIVDPVSLAQSSVTADFAASTTTVTVPTNLTTVSAAASIAASTAISAATSTAASAAASTAASTVASAAASATHNSNLEFASQPMVAQTTTHSATAAKSRSLLMGRSQRHQSNRRSATDRAMDKEQKDVLRSHVAV